MIQEHSPSPTGAGVAGHQERWFFWLSLLLCVAASLYIYRLPVGGLNISLFRIVYLGWILLFATDLIRRRISLRHETVMLLGLLGLLAVVQISDVLRATTHLQSLARDASVHLVNLSLIPLTALYANTPERIRLFVRAFVLASLVPFVVTAWTLASGALPYEDVFLQTYSDRSTIQALAIQYGSLLRASGAFYDPNFYGAYLVVAIALGMYHIRFIERTWAMSLLTGLNLGALALTLSRTAWIGLVALMAMALLTIPWKRRIAVACSALSIGAVAIMASFALPMFAKDVPGIASRFTDFESVSERLQFLGVGIDAFADQPLFGAGSSYLIEQGLPEATAHTAYLSWLAKYGLTGFLLYAILMFTPFAVAMGRSNVDKSVRWLLLFSVVPLATLYLGYDFFPFLEFQYLLFGIWYGIFINRLESRSLAPTGVAARAFDAFRVH